MRGMMLVILLVVMWGGRTGSGAAVAAPLAAPRTQDFMTTRAELIAANEAAHRKLAAQGAPAEAHRALDDAMLATAREVDIFREREVRRIFDVAGVPLPTPTGTAPGADGSKGILGDIDFASLDPVEFRKVQKAAQELGYPVTKKGDYFTIEGLDVTNHRKPPEYFAGNEATSLRGEVGQAGVESDLKGRAAGKETAMGFGAEVKNPHVDALDNLKKGAGTLAKDAAALTREDLFTLTKMTIRNVEAGIKDPTSLTAAEVRTLEEAGVIRKGLSTAERTEALNDLGQRMARVKQGYSLHSEGLVLPGETMEDAVKRLQTQARALNQVAVTRTAAAATEQTATLRTAAEAADEARRAARAQMETAQEAFDRLHTSPDPEVHRAARTALDEATEAHRVARAEAEGAKRSLLRHEGSLVASREAVAASDTGAAVLAEMEGARVTTRTVNGTHVAVDLDTGDIIPPSRVREAILKGRDGLVANLRSSLRPGAFLKSRVDDMVSPLTTFSDVTIPRTKMGRVLKGAGIVGAVVGLVANLGQAGEATRSHKDAAAWQKPGIFAGYLLWYSSGLGDVSSAMGEGSRKAWDEHEAKAARGFREPETIVALKAALYSPGVCARDAVTGVLSMPGAAYHFVSEFGGITPEHARARISAQAEAQMRATVEGYREATLDSCQRMLTAARSRLDELEARALQEGSITGASQSGELRRQVEEAMRILEIAAKAEGTVDERAQAFRQAREAAGRVLSVTTLFGKARDQGMTLSKSQVDDAAATRVPPMPTVSPIPTPEEKRAVAQWRDQCIRDLQGRQEADPIRADNRREAMAQGGARQMSCGSCGFSGMFYWFGDRWSCPGCETCVMPSDLKRKDGRTYRQVAEERMKVYGTKMDEIQRQANEVLSR